MIIDTYPEAARIIDIQTLTPQIKRFRLELEKADVKSAFSWKPGQFIELSLLGFGEGPFGIANSPMNNAYIDVSINKVGVLTTALHQCKIGDRVYVRGPFGNGFDMDSLKGQNLLIVAGGCGLPPLRSVIEYVHEKRADFAKLLILIGARSPQDLLFTEEYGQWKDFADIWITVDKVPAGNWDGNTGVITTLFDKVEIPIENTSTLVCGPPIMYKFVIQKLLGLNFNPDKILVSLERNMKCGASLCQHCTIGKRYVCKDGPVFTYSETKGMFDKGHDEEGEGHSVCSAI